LVKDGGVKTNPSKPKSRLDGERTSCEGGGKKGRRSLLEIYHRCSCRRAEKKREGEKKRILNE